MPIDADERLKAIFEKIDRTCPNGSTFDEKKETLLQYQERVFKKIDDLAKDAELRRQKLRSESLI